MATKMIELKQQRKVCSRHPVRITCGYVQELHDDAAADEADDDSEPGFAEVFHVGICLLGSTSFQFVELLFRLLYAAVTDRRV